MIPRQIHEFNLFFTRSTDTDCRAMLGLLMSIFNNNIKSDSSDYAVMYIYTDMYNVT